MKKLHLHIGSYKTGTSSIQETLFQNRELLLKQGFCFPGNEAKHHKFFFVTKANKSDWPREFKNRNKNILQAEVDSFFSSLEQDFHNNCIEQVISTEYLFINTISYVENIYNFLNNFFDEIVVYLFVRSPISYYRSFQQQMIKGRSFIDSPVHFHYNFRSVINTWSQFFNLKVVEFNSNNNSALIFCKMLGLNVRPAQSVNTSMSVEKMALVEKVQRFNYQDLQDILKPHLYPLIRSSEFAFSSKPELQDWVKPIIYNNHREDLKWLKENYGIDFLQPELEAATPPSLPEFTSNRVSVRDVYEVDEQSVERYEALVMDALLKNLVKNGNRSPAPRLR